MLPPNNRGHARAAYELARGICHGMFAAHTGESVEAAGLPNSLRPIKLKITNTEQPRSPVEVKGVPRKR